MSCYVAIYLWFAFKPAAFLNTENVQSVVKSMQTLRGATIFFDRKLTSGKAPEYCSYVNFCS